MMLPPQVTVVPLYVMLSKLHLVGSLWPLIIPNWFGDAFSIFLLRQFFLTIPEEYPDAARVDGCGEFRILPPSSCGWRSRRSRPSRCSPSSTPGTTSSGRCSTSGENPDTLDAVGRARRSSARLHQVQWNLTMAATLLFMRRSSSLFFAAQKAFVEGVTLTGVKG